ncbi:MAG: hypothetical protein ACYSSI_07055 [Planctomycetota bacterium]
MSDSNLLQMFVLDVLKYDIEQIDSICNLLNDTGCIGWRDHWPNDFSRGEVVEALFNLCKQGLVEILINNDALDELVYLDVSINNCDSITDDMWFKLTKEGKKKWDNWVPPIKESEQNR